MEQLLLDPLPASTPTTRRAARKAACIQLTVLLSGLTIFGLVVFVMVNQGRIQRDLQVPTTGLLTQDNADLSDSLTLGATLGEVRKMVLRLKQDSKASVDSLSAKVLTLEKQLRMAGEEATRKQRELLQECDNKVQAESNLLKTQLHRHELRFNNVDAAVQNKGHEVLGQCHSAIQSATQPLSLQLRDYETRLNTTDTGFRQYTRQLFQECTDTSQAASTSLTTRVLNLEHRVNDADAAMNVKGQEVLQQCKSEIQAGIEPLKAQMVQDGLRINETNAATRTVTSQLQQDHETSQTVIVNLTTQLAQLEQRVNATGSEVTAKGQELLEDCKGEIRTATEPLLGQINQNEARLNQTITHARNIERQLIENGGNSSQPSSESLTLRVLRLEERVNATDVASEGAGQELLSQCQSSIQAATQPLAQQLQHYQDRLNHTDVAVVEMVQETLKQCQVCQSEVLNITEPLQAQMNQYETRLNQTELVLATLRTQVPHYEYQNISLNTSTTNYLTNQILLLQQRLNITGTEASEQHEDILQQCRTDIQASIEPLTAQIQDLINNTQAVIDHNQPNPNDIIPVPTQVIHNDSVASGCFGTKVLYGTYGILELTSSMYTHGKDCGWRVMAPQGSVITLKWLKFDLEPHDQCNYDWVKVQDVSRPTMLEYGTRLCGNPSYLTRSFITINNNEVDITFHSDNSNSKDGFRVEYQALQIPNSQQSALGQLVDTGTSLCSGVQELRGTSGILDLPSSTYTSNMDCTWRVVAPEGSVLALEWLKFDLEPHDTCNFDWVKVVDMSRSSDMVYGQRLCGSASFLDYGLWLVSNKEIEVTFHSDGSNSYDGFRLRYQALQIPYGPANPINQVIQNYTMVSECSGNKVVTGTWGKLALSVYRHGADCNWVVIAPTGSVISLKWLKFSLESHATCNYDYVQVTDLNRNSLLVYGKKLCGSETFLLRRSWLVASNRIKIAFHSDSSDGADGFIVEYQALMVPNMIG